MKNLRRNKIMEDYRENHLIQMRKKVSKELLYHSLEVNSKLTVLKILAHNKTEKEKGEK